MRHAALRLAIASFALLPLSCSGVVETYEVIQGPQFGTDGETFRPVSAVMEARCGTLDCHGQMSRPLRIFGQQGLRMPLEAGVPVGYVTGGAAATTPDELLANFAAMCGLEPEILEAVVKGSQPPDALTLVRKPRLEEKHKGGQIWNPNDPGDRCLTNWLTGVSLPGSKPKVLDTTDCVNELQHP